MATKKKTAAEPKSEIKRYDTTSVYIGCGEYVGDVEETEDGDYVLFDDHRAIVERLQKDAALGAAVREAVGCMNAHMIEGHTTAPGFTLRQERIISVHQLNVLRAIADALRAEEGGSDAG